MMSTLPHTPCNLDYMTAGRDPKLKIQVSTYVPEAVADLSPGASGGILGRHHRQATASFALDLECTGEMLSCVMDYG